jgi:hypothetical protein
MKVWISMVVASTLMAGCYRAHGYGDDSDAEVPFVDQSLPVEVTVMTRLGALEAVPAAGARVVVQDCDTPRQAEATTNDHGVATFDFGDVRCWTVTALLDDEARSVVRAPVPMPGPIVFPREAVSSPPGAFFAYRVAVEPRTSSIESVSVDVGRNNVYGSGRCTTMACTGSMYDPAALGAGFFTVLTSTENGNILNGAVGQLPPPVDSGAPSNSLSDAQVTLPAPPPPVRRAGVVVRMPSSGEYFASADDPWLGDGVRGTEPTGSRLQVGNLVDFDSELTETERVITARYEWLTLQATSLWSAPTSRYDSAASDHDACRVPRVSGRDVFLQDGQTVEIRIPPVEVRELSGSSVATLTATVGGEGHRGYLSLRTAGPQSLFWVIEPYNAGVFQMDTLPPLPSGVADERGITTRSVHVQVGVTSPGRAAFAHFDTADTAAPWWVRDGIVFGQLADFGLSDAECDAL